MTAEQLDDWPAVSVVLPVLNEERHLAAAVGSVLGQDYPGDVEIVLALGPSKDRTDDVARSLAREGKVRLVRNPTGRTAVGLNLAIRASTAPIVARVDGHAALSPGYLKTAVRLIRDHDADNVGGRMSAEGVTDFEQAVARAMTSKLGVGNAPFHVGGSEGPADTVYLGVFRREALERIGGYDEKFTRAQDWEMNYRIRQSGGLVWFNPDLSVSYRPRGGVKALAKQYFHYGRWRRQVMRRHPGSINARYLAPPVALIGVSGGLVAGALWRRSALALPAGYAALVLVGAQLVGGDLPGRARADLPFVLATMHMSWAAGFLTSR